MPFVRQPQEEDTLHDYYFLGLPFITSNAKDEINEVELNAIFKDLKSFVQSRPQGIDYLQVYKHEDGRVIWVIDNVSKQMRESGGYTEETLLSSDYWTILLPDDY